jgi:hypothetical protein
MPVSPTQSVAVSFTAARDGDLNAVNLVASRVGNAPVGLLAYLVTANDPNGGDHPAAPPAPSGSEPGCWGYISDTAVPALPRAVHIDGYPCQVKAGRTYWIQFGTATGATSLYPRLGGSASAVASRAGAGANWHSSQVPGGLDVAAVVR